MKMGLIKFDNKTICSVVSPVMCLFRDSMYMVRIIDLISLLFLTLLSGYLYFSDSYIRARGYFTLLLFNLFVAVLFTALAGSVYGMPEHSRSLAVLTGLNYFFPQLFF